MPLFSAASRLLSSFASAWEAPGSLACELDVTPVWVEPLLLSYIPFVAVVAALMGADRVRRSVYAVPARRLPAAFL